MGQSESSVQVDDLCAAAERGDVAAVAGLLGSVPVNSAKANTGWTALHFACEANQVAVAELLLDKGADVNAVTTDWGATPLHLALSGNPNAVLLVALLLQRGADANVHNRDGVTPLQLATDLNDKLSIRALLKRGAQTDERSRAMMAGDVAITMDESADVPLISRKSNTNHNDNNVEATLRRIQGNAPAPTRMTDRDIAIACEALSEVSLADLDARALTKLNSFLAAQLERTIAELKRRNNSVDLLMDDDD
jgi:ankyrin repeat protein